MAFKSVRLTVGEWLLGLGSLLLLIDLFGFTWFAYRPQFHALAVMLSQSPSANGWNTFTILGPLTLVVCVAGIAAALLTACRPSPAWPVVITTLLLPVSFVQVLLMAIRVLLDAPTVHLAQAGGANVVQAHAGAYAGLVLSVVVFAGVYVSLRREGVAADDSPARVELFPIS
jgi:hypothetical protein